MSKVSLSCSARRLESERPGPVLCLLCRVDIMNIAESYGATAHSYADYTQLYVHCKSHNNYYDCATEDE